MYHPYSGNRIRFFEYYIYEDMFFIEIDKTYIPDGFIGFNMVGVMLAGHRHPFEQYIYKTDELIYLFEETNELRE